VVTEFKANVKLWPVTLTGVSKSIDTEFKDVDNNWLVTTAVTAISIATVPLKPKVNCWPVTFASGAGSTVPSAKLNGFSNTGIETLPSAEIPTLLNWAFNNWPVGITDPLIVNVTEFKDVLNNCPVTLTARGCLIYNTSFSNSAVAVLNFGADKTATSGTFTIQFPAFTSSAAIIRIS